VWLDDLNVTQAIDPNAREHSASVRASATRVGKVRAGRELPRRPRDFRVRRRLREAVGLRKATQTLVDETLVPPGRVGVPECSVSLKGPEERAKSEAARLAKKRKDTPLDRDGWNRRRQRSRHASATRGARTTGRTTTPPSASERRAEAR
jgi:hypothetical protein